MFLSHFGLLGHRKCPDNIRLRCNTHFCPHVPHIPAHTNTNTHTHTHRLGFYVSCGLYKSWKVYVYANYKLYITPPTLTLFLSLLITESIFTFSKMYDLKSLFLMGT